MKITLVPSAYSAAKVTIDQNLTSYLVNDNVAIDAGAIGFYGRPEKQARIRHIFLTHSHIDHIASLPAFLENTLGLSPTPVIIHASEAVQYSLRHDMFNDRLWPNFVKLTYNEQPILKFHTIESGQPVEVEGLRVTPVNVDHVVPTHGFILEDARAAVVIPSDTGPTEDIWNRANATSNLKAVFLEAAFPNEYAWLATISKHLTTSAFVGEMRKLQQPATFFAVHLKSQLRTLITRELLEYGLPNIEIARFGRSYEF